MKLSVIIPTRNRAALLEKALKSILTQTLSPEHFEVIVVDNGSTDNTFDVVNSFKSRVKNIRYFLERQPGLHAGRHRGLAEAESNLLVYADDDIEAFPTWLQAIQDSFGDEEVVVVGGKCVPKFEVEPPDWLNAMWMSNAAGEHVLGYLSVIDLGDATRPVNPDQIFGCNFAVRRSVLLEAGGFHPDSMPQDLIRFRGDGETWVSKYIQSRGYKALYNPGASVYHWVPASRMTTEYFFSRSYSQGVSDSYAAIRHARGIVPPQVTTWGNRDFYRQLVPTCLSRVLAAVSLTARRLHVTGKGCPASEEDALCRSLAASYEAGYAFHQALVRESSELLAWVLKPDYFDCRLPLPGNETREENLHVFPQKKSVLERMSVTPLRKTAMICYEYAFEVSPTLKNICTYLFDQEGMEVDVCVDLLYRDRHFKMPGITIIEVLSCGFLSPFVRKLSEQSRRKLYKWYVRKRLGGYERIIVADFTSLALAYEMGADLSRVVYVSLESTDLISRYPLELARRLLGSCSLRIIQSRERAEDLTRYLGIPLPFEYLPVSSRPSSFKRNPDVGTLKIIYSGYIAEWACLAEFVAAIRDSSLLEKVSLTIQGHAIGTEGYLESLVKTVSVLPNVKIDTGYYDEDQYMKMMANHDIGLAFYKNLSGSSNFENMILSSGKISNYLWSGMAVMTNIDAKETHRLPFIYLEPSEADKLCSVLDSFRVNRDECVDASFDLARAHYDFDAHMKLIYEKMTD